MNFDLQVVDLLSIVNRSIEEMSDVAKQRRVKFVLEASANDGKVIVDVDRLLKVFTNLLANAARLSPANDRVTIRVLRHRNMLRVAITDHGPGVPDSFKKQIFEKFAQVDSADVRYKAGAGLGLSLAKAIVERFGGNISYDSVAYKETTFFVDLPEVDEP
jgi:signal transduction histidine kinase